MTRIGLNVQKAALVAMQNIANGDLPEYREALLKRRMQIIASYFIECVCVCVYMCVCVCVVCVWCVCVAPIIELLLDLATDGDDERKEDGLLTLTILCRCVRRRSRLSAP